MTSSVWGSLDREGFWRLDVAFPLGRIGNRERYEIAIHILADLAARQNVGCLNCGELAYFEALRDRIVEYSGTPGFKA